MPVNCHNEWDPLEEVIVGRLEGACVPPSTIELKSCLNTKSAKKFLYERGGSRFPLEHTEKAKAEVENFCSILKSEGVIVRRPDVVDFQEGYKTPDFESPVGAWNAFPRYVTIIENYVSCNIILSILQRFHDSNWQ